MRKWAEASTVTRLRDYGYESKGLPYHLNCIVRLFDSRCFRLKVAR